MRRIGSTTVWPVPIAARRQQADRVRRIGVLMVNAESSEDGRSRLPGISHSAFSDDGNSIPSAALSLPMISPAIFCTAHPAWFDNTTTPVARVGTNTI